RFDTGGNGTTSTASDENIASAGATGTRTATAANSAAWVAQLVALNPDTLTVSVAGNGTYLVGKTGYYSPANFSGSPLPPTQTASDSVSGLANVTFPSFANFTGGGADTTSPYSTTYGWNGSATANGAQDIIATGNSGTTSTYSSAFTLALDSTAPSGESVAL